MNASLFNLISSFPHALMAGILIAVVCAWLGVFVILKRVVFIGITLSEMAACGIAVALILHIPPFVGAIALTLLAVGVLAIPFESQRVPRDTVLGVLFVAASSLSVLLVSRNGFGLHEIKSLLYGDLILTTPADLRVVSVVLIPALACLALFVRPILYAFLDREAAAVLGVKPGRWELLFFVVLGLVVAAASKVAGAMLVFCYLIAPPAVGLLLARRLWLVLAIACSVAVFSTVAGLFLSFASDWPTNQTICVTACFLLLLVGLGAAIRHLFTLRRNAREQTPASRAD
jgi:ABC-type Mn2+/Zn2+ transport system permease subunit